MPNLYIIAGPNGAGKSTYVKRFLNQEICCREFVNADVIAAELSPNAPDEAAFEAGRIMLRRLHDLATAGKDFAFETTLSGKAYAPMIKAWREKGYRVRIDFLWIPDFGISRGRVRQRVTKGGHDIPIEVQRRRFHLGIRNLALLYRPLSNSWRLFDNSGEAPLLVAQEIDGLLEVADVVRLDSIERAASIRLMNDIPSDRVGEPAIMLSFEEETRRALRAMRKAFADVVLENRAFGLPVIQWRQGRGVVEVPAEQLEPLARRILEVNGEPLPEAEERALLAHVKV